MPRTISGSWAGQALRLRSQPQVVRKQTQICSTQPQLQGFKIVVSSESANVNSSFFREAGPCRSRRPTSLPEPSWREGATPPRQLTRVQFHRPSVSFSSIASSGPCPSPGWLSRLLCLHPHPLPSTTTHHRKEGFLKNMITARNPLPTFLYLANSHSSVTSNVNALFSRRPSFTTPSLGSPSGSHNSHAQSSLFYVHCIARARKRSPCSPPFSLSPADLTKSPGCSSPLSLDTQPQDHSILGLTVIERDGQIA